MMVFVFRRTGSDLDESGLECVDGAEETFDTLDFAHATVRRLDRAVSEMFLYAEHVDPALRKRETDGHVFARDLAVLAADVAGHKNVRTQFHFVTGNAESGAHLKRKFAILRRPDAEA